MKFELSTLEKRLLGELKVDELYRTIYATDASVYKQLPLAVAFPKGEDDLRELISFAGRHGVSLIPRTAGTSLAGQCVGEGIVVDVSRHLTRIIEVDQANDIVWLEPGVIRDELNDYLSAYGLYFGPNTSTANRCMIGGMVGNNSSGTTSIEYGTTRDHVWALEGFLSDGSKVTFGELSLEQFYDKCKLDNLEGAIYRQLNDILSDQTIRQEIINEFPKASIHRRNQGYALDVLMNMEPFGDGYEQRFNMAKLVSGSEGTLFFITKIALKLDPLPKPKAALLCAHFNSIHDSLLATQVAMRHAPSLCELMDKIILDCTIGSKTYEPMRQFVAGDPEALLMVELRADTQEEASNRAMKLVEDMKSASLGYAYPILLDKEAANAFKLRSAGLGLLSNIEGDAKPVACIEDTAVALEDLPEYINEFSLLMSEHQQRAVFYAHAGAGELHLRPILNLKTSQGVKQFRQITEQVAHLVKKYGGTLSGEHGDGRVRAEFLPIIIGQKLYELCCEIKTTWDPNYIFNPGKIVKANRMDESLRYEQGEPDYEFDTAFDYGKEGMMSMIERCNGSGDCRRTHHKGALMCPSYMATKDEKDSTRGRANALREFLKSTEPNHSFGHQALRDAMDLCISCKGCTSECPSNVDMATLKAEYLYQRSKKEGLRIRDRLFSHFYSLHIPLSWVPALGNMVLSAFEPLIKSVVGISQHRKLPKLSATSAKRWLRIKMSKSANANSQVVYLFADEMTDLHEAHLYLATYGVLTNLGYQVRLANHKESGRAAISKGDLKYAKSLAEHNVKAIAAQLNDDDVLLGIEPSSILSFRDEYPRLVEQELREKSHWLAKRVFTIEEFLYNELTIGKYDDVPRPKHRKKLILHGHCHQKALSDIGYTAEVLEQLGGYMVEVIASSCCGMAGSFGYEKEHYEVSMKIGELVLFPAIRNKEESTGIAASGVSCRHQILDGTSEQALHPIEYLWQAVSHS